MSSKPIKTVEDMDTLDSCLDIFGQKSVVP